MKKPLIGAHVSYKKENQLLDTINDLILIKATSGAIYISNSRAYIKFPLNEKKLLEAQKIALENKFNIENIIVHAPLVGNIANTDKDSDIHKRTLESYYADLVTMHKSGLKLFNFHPGSSPDTYKAIKQIADSINELHERTKDHNTILLLETMMKKGNYIGINFEQLKQIIDLVNNKERVGVCFDTCHVWDAGYNLKEFDNVLEEFDKVIGLENLKALHINDSKNDLGSSKDRHEEIGKGYIGLKTLKEIVNHKSLRDIPKALETPYGKNDFKKWKDEIELLIN